MGGLLSNDGIGKWRTDLEWIDDDDDISHKDWRAS